MIYSQHTGKGKWAPLFQKYESTGLKVGDGLPLRSHSSHRILICGFGLF
jgi:hypothetical protein